jgi:hypothetical protein
MSTKTKGPFMEIIRAKSEADSETLMELEIPFPVGRAENIAMLIHFLLFWVKCPTPQDGARTTNRGVLTLHRQGNIEDANDIDFFQDGVLGYYQVTHDETTADHFYWMEKGLRCWTFDPPLLVARSSAWLQAMNNNDAGNTGMGVTIGYTLAKVDREDFVNALTE